MAIKQYKGRPARLQGAPIIARLYKGEARATYNGKGVPPELPYFRVVFETNQPMFDVEKAAQVWKDLYGEQPTVLRNVLFQFDNPDLVFSDHMEWWKLTGKGNPILLRRCDGETTAFRKEGDTVERNVTCDHRCECKPVGRLTFWLPEFTTAMGGVVGQFMLITHGTEDLDRIRSTVQMVRETLGQLRNIAFTLYRTPTAKRTPDGNPITKHDVYLGLSDQGAQRLALQAAENALMLNSSQHLLPAITTWANSEWVNRLVLDLREWTVPNLSYSEAARMGGIDNPKDPNAWNKFKSFDDAFNYIVAVFKAETEASK